jgi:hypothetical protein
MGLSDLKLLFTDGESDPDAVGSIEEAPLDDVSVLDGDNAELVDSQPTAEESKS